MLTYTVAMLSLSASAMAQADCWYGALCPIGNAASHHTIIEGNDAVDMEAKMLFCQAECEADKSNGGDCEYFSVFNFRGKPGCYLLSSCDNPEDTPDCVDESCNSGPRDCANNPSCPMLTANTDDSKINWQCDNGVNPYTQQVPPKTVCFLSCAGWVDRDDNSKAVMVKSQCGKDVAGEYGPSEVSDDSLVVDALPSPLPQPDDIEADQASCGCATLNMAWDAGADGLINYDPNTLLGVDFICLDDPIEDDQGTKKFLLKDGNICRLFCDSYHVATMECQGGQWTGEPELGAWCYAEPGPDDEMNGGGTTVPPTQETTV